MFNYTQHTYLPTEKENVVRLKGCKDVKKMAVCRKGGGNRRRTDDRRVKPLREVQRSGAAAGEGMCVAILLPHNNEYLVNGSSNSPLSQL